SRLVAPDQPYEPPLDIHLVGAEDARLELGVGSLERDRGAPFAQALEGRLLMIDQSHDDVAILGRIAPANDDRIAIVDSRLDHGVAFDLEREMLAIRQEIGRAGDIVRMVLNGGNWHAGG